jgi:NhaP-type Na+/H+ or K+/H+ antiporter
LNIDKRFDLSNSLRLFRVNISKKQLLDRLSIFLKALVEYAFGMHIGYAIGWVLGLYVGHFYVEYFEPVYFDDLSELNYWRLAPYIFARSSAVIGVVVGVISVAVINSLVLGYSEEPDNSDRIARFPG